MSFIQKQRLSFDEVIVSSKKFEINNMMKEILPDNRPITGFKVVEDLQKCPSDYQAIARTHDTDSDAELWRASSGLFARNVTSRRYLCLTKTCTGHSREYDYVVDSISIIGDKEHPPEGFTQMYKTSDSQQRAWRKKQLCYRMVKSSNASKFITDVIVCSSRCKRPPAGFCTAGEINGLLVCYKTRDSDQLAPLVPHRPVPPPVPPPRPSLMKDGVVLSNGHNNNTSSDLRPGGPVRPAPGPPLSPHRQPCRHNYSTSTLGTCGNLDGVPFVLSDRVKNDGGGDDGEFLGFRGFTLSPEYDYNFSLEYQTLNATK